MTNLTEKWKSGGLEKNKKYYTTDKLGRSYIKTHNKKGFKGLVHEVLAPVPSYEEWEEKQKSLKVLAEAYCKEKEENKQLKDMLKEYKKQLSEIKIAYINLTTQDEYGSYYIDEAKLFVEIVGKIIKKILRQRMKNER